MTTAAATNSADSLPSHCFLQVSVAGEIAPDPIVIELFTDQCPDTCRNFATLCGSTETTRKAKPFPTYRGCDFHRIIENFMIQCGDFERFDGSGGYSPIFPGGKFPDEYLRGKHDQAGILSMANKGKNTNSSQFFITLKATPHLDGKHVVFGRVIQGMDTILKMLLVERVDDRPVPLQRVAITDCGHGKGSPSAPTFADKGGQRRKKSRDKRKQRKRRDYSSSSSCSESSSHHSSSSEVERRLKRRRKQNRRRPGEYRNNSDDEPFDDKKKTRRGKERSKDDHRSRKKKKRK